MCYLDICTKFDYTFELFTMIIGKSYLLGGSVGTGLKTETEKITKKKLLMNKRMCNSHSIVNHSINSRSFSLQDIVYT